MRWAGHAACIDVIRKVHTVLVREPETKRQLQRHRPDEEGVGLVLGPAAGCYDHASGSSVFVKHGTIHRPGYDSC